MKTLAIAALLASLPALCADLESNTVTVRADRPLNLQPDLVQLSVSVLVPLNAGLSDVLAILNGSGISATDLGSVGGDNAYTEWDFSRTLRFDQTTAVFTVLSKLETPTDRVGAPRISFWITGLQSSKPATDACSLPALVSDARRQADALAAAAGMKTGAIVSVTDGTSIEPILDPSGVRYGSFALSRVGDFSQSLVRQVFAPQPFIACTLTVQFKLLP